MAVSISFTTKLVCFLVSMATVGKRYDQGLTNQCWSSYVPS